MDRVFNAGGKLDLPGAKVRERPSINAGFVRRGVVASITDLGELGGSDLLKNPPHIGSFVPFVKTVHFKLFGVLQEILSLNADKDGKLTFLSRVIFWNALMSERRK